MSKYVLTTLTFLTGLLIASPSFADSIAAEVFAKNAGFEIMTSKNSITGSRCAFIIERDTLSLSYNFKDASVKFAYPQIPAAVFRTAANNRLIYKPKFENASQQVLVVKYADDGRIQALLQFMNGQLVNSCVTGI